MTYVALLRGINVGGKNKVDMRTLASVFEDAGMSAVRTYINSGNVVFVHESAAVTQLARALSAAIEAEVGLNIDVLVVTGPRMLALADALPDDWANDTHTKCDVLFLWPENDDPSIMERLDLRPGIDDDARYEPGAVLWRVERGKVTRSAMLRIVGTPLYKGITVRNCNTLRRLAALVRETDAAQA